MEGVGKWICERVAPYMGRVQISGRLGGMVRASSGSFGGVSN